MRKYLSLCTTLFLFTLIGCDYPEQPTSYDLSLSKKFNISGIIYGSDYSTPLSNVSVKLSSFGSVNTNSNGEFSFSEVPEGIYVLVATSSSRKYYFPQYLNISLLEGTNTNNLVIQLPNGLIKGIMSYSGDVQDVNNLVGESYDEVTTIKGDETSFVVVDFGSNIPFPLNKSTVHMFAYSDSFAGSGEVLVQLYTSESPSGFWIKMGEIRAKGSGGEEVLNIGNSLKRYVKITNQNPSDVVIIRDLFVGP